jgi:hypothetical protein
VFLEEINVQTKLEEVIRAFGESAKLACQAGISRIILSGYCGDEHKVHPQGAIIRNCYDFFFNGSVRIHEGEYEEWFPHLKGFLGRIGRRFYLNGELISNREYDDFYIVPDGVIVTTGDRIFRNERLIFQGRYRDLVVGPDGVVMIRIGNNIFLEGTRLIHSGECDSFWWHPQGFAVVIGNKIIKNDTEVLFEGEFDKVIVSHPEKGLLVRRCEGIFADGTSMVCSKQDAVHFEDPDQINDFGAVIREGNSLVLITFLA